MANIGHHGGRGGWLLFLSVSVSLSFLLQGAEPTVPDVVVVREYVVCQTGMGCLSGWGIPDPVLLLQCGRSNNPDGITRHLVLAGVSVSQLSEAQQVDCSDRGSGHYHA